MLQPQVLPQIPSTPSSLRVEDEASYVLVAPSPMTDLAPALSIPSELLHAVFTFAVEPSSSDIDINEKNSIRLEVLSYSQVCQKWRLAARDCPVLWIHAVDLRSQPLDVIADLLPLSRPHPIAISHRSAPLRIADQRDLSVLNLLKHEAYRVREWNAEFRTHALEGNQLNVLMRAREDWISTSNLQPSLTILRYKGGWTALLWDLRQHAPTLHKLSIYCEKNAHLPLQPALRFDILTEFQICGVSICSSIMAEGWLRILAGMPNLQFLALHDVVRFNPQTAAGLLLNVCLPRLRILSIRDKDWSCIEAAMVIWFHLLVPDRCGVELRFRSSLQAQNAALPVQAIMDLLREFIGARIGVFAVQTNFTPAETPQIEIDIRPTPIGCRLTYGTVRDPDSTLDWNGKLGTGGVTEYLNIHAARYPKFPPISIVFDNAFSTDVDHVFRVTRDIFREASNVKIQMTTKSSSRESIENVASALPSLLSRLPKLRVLKLDQTSASILRDLFILIPSDPGFEDSTQLRKTLLPNLRQIVLELEDEKGPGQGRTSERDRAVGEFEKYARWRETCGFPVEFVVL